jgi:hypothetical protein
MYHFVDPCPKYFTDVGDHCYHYDTVNQVPWSVAQSYCQSMGARLATFETVEKWAFAHEWLMNGNCLSQCLYQYIHNTN